MSFLSSYKWPILTGILIPVSYMPFPPWAIFFCFIPLWHFAMKQNEWKNILIGGWICQVAITLCGGNWVSYTIKEFGGFSWPASIIIFSLFATAANLQIPIALALWFVCHKKLKQQPMQKINSIISYLLLPIIFSLCMLYYPTLFRWHLGYTWFFAKWPAAQTAEIWGFQFINSLILFSNLLFLIVLRKPFSLKRAFKPITIWALVFGGLNLWGTYLKHRWPEPTHTVHALIVQPNILPPSSENREDEIHFYKEQEQKLFRETQNHFPSDKNIDFILWPEGGFPFALYDSINYSNTTKKVSQFVQSLNSSLIVSAIRRQSKGYSNSIFVFNKQGQLTQTPYDKIHLMAFGEYWPSALNWIPFIEKLYPYFNRSFLKGSGEFTVAPLYGTHIGFLICYEGLSDQLTKNLSRKGAHILLNSSNDMWYGKWQQPWQHLYMTLARAIEVRRPVIRGTNSGFSSVITAKGNILYRSELGIQTSRIQQVPYNQLQKHTVFSSWGYYLNQTVLWIMLLCCFLLYWLKVYFIGYLFKKNR